MFSNIKSFQLLLLQIFAHIGLIYQICYGNLTMWVISVIVYFITGCFGMTMTYHRLLSHRSWTSPKWFEYFGTLCGVWGLTGSSIGWVAIHREHHRYTDTKLDPHTPLYKNFFKIQFLSMFENAKIKYAMDLFKLPFHIILHRYYFIIHLTIITILFIIDYKILICLYLAPAAILWNAGSFINTINHMFGYRNYNTKDSSTNFKLLGYIVWGEGWHNNHHNSPTDPNFKRKWWEFDIGYFFIKLIKINHS